ncbi:MAG: hypothetical protein ABIJ18_02300 [archaeon]
MEELDIEILVREGGDKLAGIASKYTACIRNGKGKTEMRSFESLTEIVHWYIRTNDGNEIIVHLERSQYTNFWNEYEHQKGLVKID